MTNGSEDEDLKAEATARRTALIDAGLFVEDPTDTQGLVYPIPPNRDLMMLEVSYDTKETTGEKVRCAVCPTHTKHYRGFIGRLDNDSRALIGINCGESHFGKGVWAELSASLEARQNDAHYRARIGPARAQIEAVYPLMRDIKEAMNLWTKFRAELGNEHRLFARELEKAATKGGGKLTRDREVEVTVVDQAGRERREIQVQSELFGHIPFPEGFGRVNIERSVKQATEALKAANKILTAQSTTRELAEGFRILRDGRNAIRDAKSFYNGCKKNLSTKWWQTACDWSNFDRTDERLIIKNGLLLEQDKIGNMHPVKIPNLPNAPFDVVLNRWPR